MAAGQITIDLLLKTGAFETDTKRAEKRLRELKKEAEAIGKSIGLAFVAVGAASVALVKSAIDAADATSKLAQQTGTTVEELSALTYAAGLADVSQEELGSALVKLTKNMSDAARGTGEAIEGFNALGISVKNADGSLKGSDKVFAEVADKFAGMRDGAEKTALAVNIFGKSGAQLIPLLNAGASGLQAMKEEALKLGVVLDTQVAKSAEEFNDNLTRMGQAISGVGNRAAADLLPALNDVSSALVDLAKNEAFVSTTTAIVRGALDTLIVVFQTLAVVGSDVGFVFLSVGREIGAWAAQIGALASGNLSGFRAISDAVKADGERARAELDKFQARVMAIGGVSAPADFSNEGRNSIKPAGPRIGGGRSSGSAAKVSEFDKTIAQQRERLALLGKDTELEKINAQIILGKFGAIKPAQADALRAGAEALDQRRAEIDLVRETQAAEKARVESIASVVSALQQERDELGLTSAEIKLNQLATSGASEAEIRHAESIIKSTEAMREHQSMQEEGKRLYEETRTPSEKLNIELGRLNELLQKGAINWDTYSRAVFAAQDSFDTASNASKKAGDDIDSFSKRAAENIQDAIGDGLVDAMEGNFKNIGASFAKMITRMVAEAAAADIARKLFGDSVKGGEGSGFFGDILKSIGSAFGGAKASGGDVIGGRSYLVGEQGPERFVPRTAGTILPANQTGQRGGDTYIDMGGIRVDSHGAIDRMGEDRAARNVARKAQVYLTRRGA